MSCLYFKQDFIESMRKLYNYTSHIHISDAMGLDGEGLQIGQGEINFDLVIKELNEFCPNVSIIPEIWQGHKDYGEAFKIAYQILFDKGLK